jgi:hypothetical protein
MSEKRTVHCEEHGSQQETFVCQHIKEGLTEGQPYGFWWSDDPENARPDAWCTMCNKLVSENEGEWTDELLEIVQVKLLCGRCYDEAKSMNFSDGKK